MKVYKFILKVEDNIDVQVVKTEENGIKLWEIVFNVMEERKDSN